MRSGHSRAPVDIVAMDVDADKAGSAGTAHHSPSRT